MCNLSSCTPLTSPTLTGLLGWTAHFGDSRSNKVWNVASTDPRLLRSNESLAVALQRPLKLSVLPSILSSTTEWSEGGAAAHPVFLSVLLKSPHPFNGLDTWQVFGRGNQRRVVSGCSWCPFWRKKKEKKKFPIGIISMYVMAMHNSADDSFLLNHKCTSSEILRATEHHYHHCHHIRSSEILKVVVLLNLMD